MSEHKRTGFSKFGKGYYIALVLCLVAIGITGYLYNRNASKQTDTLVVNPTEATNAVMAETEDHIEAIATTPSGELPLPTHQETQPSQT